SFLLHGWRDPFCASRRQRDRKRAQDCVRFSGADIDGLIGAHQQGWSRLSPALCPASKKRRTTTRGARGIWIAAPPCNKLCCMTWGPLVLTEETTCNLSGHG